MSISRQVEEFNTWKAGMCNWDCYLCKDTFTDASKFWKHVQNDHDTSIHEYIQNYGDSTIIVQVMLKCQICQETMLYEPTSMTLHMKSKHSELSLYDYFKKFFGDEEFDIDSDYSGIGKEVRKKGFFQKSTENECSSAAQKSGKSCSVPKRYAGIGDSGRNLNADINVKKAGMKSFDAQDMRHCSKESFTKNRNLKRKARRPHCKTTLTRKEVEVEGNELPWTRGRIGNSLASAWLDKCKIQCQHCIFTSNSLNAVVAHEFVHHRVLREPSITDPRTKILKKEYHRCNICSEMILNELYHVKDHLNEKHDMSLINYHYNYMFKEVRALNPEERKFIQTFECLNKFRWARRSIFKCTLCNERRISQLSFSTHILCDHKMSYSDYKLRFGTSLVAADTFYCMECRKVVMSEAQEVADHLKQHGLLIKQYHSKYMRDKSIAEQVALDPQSPLFQPIVLVEDFKRPSEKKMRLEENLFSKFTQIKVKMKPS